MSASIHFPLAREDYVFFDNLYSCFRFNPLPSCEGRHIPHALIRHSTMLQSTSLLRGKTSPGISAPTGPSASIHFPLAREDPSCPNSSTTQHASIHFPLAREDQQSDVPFLVVAKLQSTSLLRGKTILIQIIHIPRIASIHFPLAREDVPTFPCSHL